MPKLRFLVVEPSPLTSRIQDHFSRNQQLYLNTAIALAALGLGATNDAYAYSNALDIQAERIYERLTDIGKWAIVFKGGADVVGSMTSGDTGRMKKQIIGYAIGYIALIALPWGFDQIDTFFKGLKHV